MDVSGLFLKRIWQLSQFLSEFLFPPQMLRTDFISAFRHLIHLHNGDLGEVLGDLSLEELHLSQNGDAFFQVIFRGGASPENGLHPFYLLKRDATRADVLPLVKFIHGILRRHPVLIHNFQNALLSLLESQDFEDPRVPIFMGLVLANKSFELEPHKIFAMVCEHTKKDLGPFLLHLQKEFVQEHSNKELVDLFVAAKMDAEFIALFCTVMNQKKKSKKNRNNIEPPSPTIAQLVAKIDGLTVKHDDLEDVVIILAKRHIIIVVGEAVNFAIGKQPRRSIPPPSNVWETTSTDKGYWPELHNFCHMSGWAEADFIKHADSFIDNRNANVHFAGVTALRAAVQDCLSQIVKLPELAVECPLECKLLQNFEHLITSFHIT